MSPRGTRRGKRAIESYELVATCRGTDSGPGEPAEHQRTAAQTVDDRGIRSMRVIEVKG